MGETDIAAFAGTPFRLAKKPMIMMLHVVGVSIYKGLQKLDEW